MTVHILEKFSKIKLLAFDLDGVLTNGKLLIHDENMWLREMNIKDGLAIQMALKNGFQIAVITGSFSSQVEKRLNYLGVPDFIQKSSSKSEALESLQNKHKISAEQTLFMGDDLPDLDAFKVAGLKTCPSDAVEEVKQQSDYISIFKGGEGCVRDVIEKTLKTQGKWNHSSFIQSI
jgi:3-deoxy-D-manno-octulosonate 8-phosphate phosphatase (KDO 8-P phosphatase)